jgi:hypothetical protein
MSILRRCGELASDVIDPVADVATKSFARTLTAG